MSRKRQRGSGINGYYFDTNVPIPTAEQQAANSRANQQRLQQDYAWVNNVYSKVGRPVSAAAGRLAGHVIGATTGQGWVPDALETLASTVHDVWAESQKAEPEARAILRDIGPATRALGYRNLRGVPSQKALSSIKNAIKKTVSKRSRAVRSTTLRNKRQKKEPVKHVKRATHKRGKENAAYVAKHQGKAPRSAQFYRDNGLPIPPNVRS